MRKLSIYIVFIFWSHLVYTGELYQWTDSDGKKHYSDKKPNNHEYKKSKFDVGQEDLPFRESKEIGLAIGSLKSTNIILSPTVSKLIDKYRPKKLSGELLINSNGRVISFTLLNRELKGTDLDQELTKAFLSLKFEEKKKLKRLAMFGVWACT